MDTSNLLSGLIGSIIGGAITLWAALKQLGETKKQVSYERMPFFRIQWSSDPSEIIQIINEGRGIALDLIFEPLIFFDQEFKSQIKIKNRPAFAPKGVSSVTVKEVWEDYYGPLKMSEDNIKSYIQGWLEHGFQVKATYKDLENNHYFVIFKSDIEYNDKFRILKQKKCKYAKKKITSPALPDRNDEIID